MNMFNMGMRKLALQPELQNELRGNKEKIESFVEEMLRTESSVQALLRVATRDIKFEGTVIPKGSNVVLSIGAANRDPARWTDPDDFHLDRPECRRHMAFGYGRHACIGMQLARREMQIAFRILLDRLHDIRLTTTEEETNQLPLPFHRGLTNLQIRFKAEVRG